jgi:hypothetical protein
MSKIPKYKAYRKDAKESGEVLFIDFENNLIDIRFITNDGKYYYDKSYDLECDDIEITELS